MATVVDTEQDIGPVRSALDIDRLNQFFKRPTPPPDTTIGPGSRWSPLVAPVSVQQFKFGQSNPTYLLTDANGHKAVLRKKPSANAKLISKTAHAIEREFHMLAAINSINLKRPAAERVPIAQVFLLCEDESHLGAVFYVMEFVKGRIFHDPSLTGASSEAEKKAIWNSVVDTAKAIHSVPSDELFAQLPEKHFRKPKPNSKSNSSSYFSRQIRSMTKIQQLQAQTVDPIPHFDTISQWLLLNAPPDPEVVPLIHGDFKIDNFVFHPTEPRIIAVLDWELCTSGHPLFDLANVLQPFVMPPEMNQIFAKFDIKQDDQLVKDVLERYKAVVKPTWDPVKLWKVGVVFGLYRVGVISQGISQRVVKGVASSAEAKKTGSLYPYVGNFAYSLISADRGAKL
ncbi:CYFA0S01e18602g1_1 [Cyberlindnera fabianii]|uniref:CYFA0S01e18602g1_1 n=1 Tax=Cyberlindnera fabianii TaxID=36022 RepID=A0A061AT29_CYBFA|nr:CYFA0S01e18602g1_1 [Cyberlindnera fabianii]